MNDIQKLVLNRRSPALAAREDIHQLIYDSYHAGVEYTRNGHLHQHYLECDYDYKKRLERSVYISHVKTLIDIIIGFIYQGDPQRTVAAELRYAVDRINPTTSLDVFMQKTAALSACFTVAILIDAPAFDPEIVKSLADREAAGLNPYAKRYLPFQIRDYSLDEKNKLNWIIFQDDYEIADDPFAKNVPVIVRSVWTKTDCTRYYYRKEERQGRGGEPEIVFDHEEKTVHALGEVPVILTSFRDIDSSTFVESFAENLALLDKCIYNYLSLLDVLLSKNAIKPLMYPSRDGNVPEGLNDAAALSKLTVIPYPLEVTNKPFYLETTNTEIESYITSINLLLQEIRNLVGLSAEQSFSGISGTAKSIELQKLTSLLKQGSKNLERVENEIMRLVCLWEKKTYNYSIEYQHEFNNEDIDILINQLNQLLTIDSKTLRALSVREMVKKILPSTDEKTMQIILDEVNEQATPAGPNEYPPVEAIVAETGRVKNSENSQDDLKDQGA